MKIGKQVFIAPNATVIGQVELADEASVWFGAVMRGDSDKITIGNRTNIQDGAIIHVDPGVPATLGNNVVIGHAAIVHGAEVKDGSLIGMRATLLNRVVVGKGCIVGANALVTEGTVIPDGSLVLGSPAKVVRQLKPEEQEKIIKNAAHYAELGKKYLAGKFEIYKH
jgi:carbonic anhydrase/acetyltransferase-like protein (isoleucine patch superfamily)